MPHTSPRRAEKLPNRLLGMLRRLRRETSAVAPVWRPIRSAPHGYAQDVIVALPDGEVTVAWFDDGVWHRSIEDGSGPDRGIRPPPTHWMPWPRPPRAAS
jgi:hypothetical protein